MVVEVEVGSIELAAVKDDEYEVVRVELAEVLSVVIVVQAFDVVVEPHAQSSEGADAVAFESDTFDVEFGEDGKATNLEAVIKSIQDDKDFSGFTPKVTETTLQLENPPANSGGKKALTWDDIDKITDTKERQKAMAENMEALGIK